MSESEKKWGSYTPKTEVHVAGIECDLFTLKIQRFKLLLVIFSMIKYA